MAGGAGAWPPGVTFGLFELNQPGEHLADLVGQFRQAIDVLLYAGPLAAAEPSREFLGQSSNRP